MLQHAKPIWVCVKDRGDVAPPRAYDIYTLVLCGTFRCKFFKSDLQPR